MYKPVQGFSTSKLGLYGSFSQWVYERFKAASLWVNMLHWLGGVDACTLT